MRLNSELTTVNTASWNSSGMIEYYLMLMCNCLDSVFRILKNFGQQDIAKTTCMFILHTYKYMYVVQVFNVIQVFNEIHVYT